jgi:hypothetical protein
MRHGKGADRPSCLAMNPGNREASAARRTRLLAAFDALPEDTRADLLELVETVAFAAGEASLERSDLRDLTRRMYASAGFESSPA